MNYEYKVVGAPERPKRRRGARTGSDRLAAAFQQTLEAEVVEGWEYLRTDTMPVAERAGWFSPTRTVNRAVMVFRRPVEAVWRRPGPEEAERTARRAPAPAEPDLHREPALTPGPAAGPAPGPGPGPGPSPAPIRGREPSISAEPDRRLAEVVRGPGARPLDPQRPSR